MFMAKYSNPYYFQKKVNIFIALDYIVHIKNTFILPPYLTLKMGQVNFCIVFEGLCDLAEGRIVDR